MNAIPEISDEVHSSDLEQLHLALFDLSTVAGKETDAEKSHKAELIEMSRPVLDGMGRLTVIDDQLLSVRSPEKKRELLADEMKLFDRHIVRSASETVLAKEKHHREYMDTSLNTMGVTMPVMPCARLDIEERGVLYDEVVRDRDKNYRAEQQEILRDFERTDVSTSTPGHYLRLGKYNKSEVVPVNYWAPAFQSFMRRDKYMRITRYISETYCIIEVFTLGIDGRVFSGGAPGRMLIIETYSFWSSKKSVLMLTIPMLNEIFAGEEEYFKPGMKSRLVSKLIEYLYFTYTIEPAEINEDDESVFSAAESQASGMPKHPDELQHNEEEQGGKESHVTNRERRLAARRARGEVIPIPNKEVYIDPEDEEDEDSLNPDGVNEEEWGDVELDVEKEANNAGGGGMFGGLFNTLGIPSVNLPAISGPPGSSGKKPRTSHSRKNTKSRGRKTPSRKSSSRGESAPAVMEKNDDIVSPLGSGRGSVGGGGGMETGRSMTSHTTLTTQELEELLPQPFLDTQVVDDLDESEPIRPDLVDYPHRVATIMRAVKDPAWVLSNRQAWKGYGLPLLTEELKIGKFPRKSAVKLRAEAEAARIKKIEDEESARKAAWLAIPPMLRGFLCSRAIFSRGACIVLRAYIYPAKPNVLVVKGHSLLECKRLQINLPLSAVGFFYGEKRSPKYWPDELKPLLVRKAVREIYAVRSGTEITDGNISLGCRDTVAFEVQCGPLKPILHGRKHNKRIKEARETVVDHRYHFWENNTPEAQEEHRKFRVPSTVMHFRDNAWPAEPRYMRPTPRRHMGVANRMYTHAGLINGVSCTLSLFYASERIPGPIPKPKKKAQKVFDRVDREWEELEAKRLEDADRLRKLEEDERLNRMREEAKRVRAQRMEEMRRRHAAFITDKEEHHKLSRRRFQEKYAAPYDLDYLAFKELWGQTEYGTWHFAALHEMVLDHERELLEIKLAQQREQEDLQRQHDEEEEAMQDPNHVHLKHHHAHGHHKHHHAYSDRRHRHRHHKYKHESGEERKALLHAVEIQEGESADEFRIRRMQEAIHLKKDKGKKDKEEPGGQEDSKPEVHTPEFYEYHQQHSRPETAATAETASDAGSEDDWVNEDTAVTGEELANQFLQEYAQGFELRLEAYFTHEGRILGQTIPAQSVLHISIRREDVYRVVPSYKEAMELLEGAYLASWQADDGGRASDEHVQHWFDRFKDLVNDLLLVSRWTVQSKAEAYQRDRYMQKQQEAFLKMSQPEEAAPDVDPLAAAAANKEAEEAAAADAEKQGQGDGEGGGGAQKAASVDDDDDFFNDVGDDDGEEEDEEEEEEEDDVKTLPEPTPLAEATCLRNRMFEVNAAFKPPPGQPQTPSAEQAVLGRERAGLAAWDQEQHREKLVTLCWPACRISHFGNDWGPQVIFRKTLKIRTSLKGHKHALMFVEVWLRGAQEMGVIATDIRRGMVHFVRPDEEYQEAQAAMLQYMAQTERVATLTVALQMDLMLVERPCTEDRDRNRVGLVFDQDAEVELSEDEEEEEIDYTEILQQQQREMEEKMAAKAAKMAEVKAKMERAKAEKQAKERREREEAEAAASQASEQEDAI